MQGRTEKHLAVFNSSESGEEDDDDNDSGSSEIDDSEFQLNGDEDTEK